MKELTAVEAKVKFGALLDEVEKGEEVLITRNGKPVARIVPPTASLAMSQAEAVEKLKSFAKGHVLGVDWKTLRDEGRR